VACFQPEETSWDWWSSTILTATCLLDVQPAVTNWRSELLKKNSSNRHRRHSWHTVKRQRWINCSNCDQCAKMYRCQTGELFSDDHLWWTETVLLCLWRLSTFNGQRTNLQQYFYFVLVWLAELIHQLISKTASQTDATLRQTDTHTCNRQTKLSQLMQSASYHKYLFYCDVK